KEGNVRHARDPHVIKVDNHYLLVYTAMHKNGCPAVGGMISNDLLHWEDIGPILYRPMPSKDWLPESINIQALDDGNWILIASQSPGLEYYISSDPHHWHDIEPQSIEFINGDKDQVVAPEIIMKNDSTQEWLIAFFESNNNRMFLGMLDLKTEPWTLKKISSL
ncbi:MAG: hypothetical protein KOO69_08090, partial [Victivallales bacterium]|nr:hypothetical protein [Victivallales bacterium]